MHSFSLGKVALATVLVAVALTGCSAKKPQKSQIAVAPIGGSAYGNGHYTGGPLVNNSAAIAAAAANMQAVVHFDFDSDAIRSDAANVLNQHAQFLTSNQGAKVMVAGHTDERGSREYNMSLGERRAAAVRAYLTSKGVNASSIEITSYGEEQPVATGSGEAAWSQNRRAELSY